MDRKRERTKIESNAIIGYAIMKYRLRCIMGILSGPVARQDEHSPGIAIPASIHPPCKRVYMQIRLSAINQTLLAGTRGHAPLHLPPRVGTTRPGMFRLPRFNYRHQQHQSSRNRVKCTPMKRSFFFKV